MNGHFSKSPLAAQEPDACPSICHQQSLQVLKISTSSLAFGFGAENFPTLNQRPHHWWHLLMPPILSCWVECLLGQAWALHQIAMAASDSRAPETCDFSSAPLMAPSPGNVLLNRAAISVERVEEVITKSLFHVYCSGF